MKNIKYFILFSLVVFIFSFNLVYSLNIEEDEKIKIDNKVELLTPDEIYDNMDRILQGLNTYIARLKIFIYAKTFNIGLTLYGKVYYKQPSKVKLVLNGLPEFLAKKYENTFYTTAIPGSTSNEFFRKKYNTKVLGIFKYRGSDCFLLKLNTKVRSSILSQYLWVRKDNFTVPLIEVNYRDGGKLKVEQFYIRKGKFFLLKEQKAEFSFPKIKAEAKTTFLEYKLNVKLDDKIFENK